MKALFVSRAVVPIFVTVALMVSFLSLSISDSLYSLEQDNPVVLALGSFHNARKTTTTISSEPDMTVNNDGPVYYPHEDPIPNPEPADGYNTFSACMLVMDDNHRLVEWLAYHYHVLPLRYLIVAVDPRSKTSPTALFNRWRKQGVYIEEWTDADFWRKDLELKPIAEDAVLQTKRDRHRGRQKFFYRSCLIKLREANRTYVTLNDSDEYVVYNHAGGNDFDEWETKQQIKHKQSSQAKHARIQPSRTPPTTAEAGAMIQYIRQEKDAGLAYYESPCIGVPRLMFGADESSSTAAAEQTDRQGQLNVPASTILPPATRVDQFDTLRYRKHAHRNDFVKNALGKVIMDISRIDIANSPNFMSLHRPIKTICTAPWHNEWDSGIRINHYLGSWESYSARDDARRGGERSLEQWQYKATTNGEETDDNIRPWLSGFVEAHGEQGAHDLLHDAGLLPSGGLAKSWKLLPDKLEKILSSDKTVANDNKAVAFDAWVRNKYKADEATTTAATTERRRRLRLRR